MEKKSVSGVGVFLLLCCLVMLSKLSRVNERGFAGDVVSVGVFRHGGANGIIDRSNHHMSFIT
jgi:hypothetical protein